MTELQANRWSERAIERANRSDIRATVVQGSVAVLAVAALLLWWYLLPLDTPDAAVFIVVPATLALLVSCYRLSATHPGWAGAMLTFIAYAIAACVAVFLDPAQAGLLFALPIILAATLFHPGAAVAVGALSLPWLAGVGAVQRQPVAIVAVCLVSLGACTATYPVHALLQWAWRRSAEATLLADMLRDRQAELNRSVAALDLTNRLLQRTNHELAVARHEADEARRVKEEFAAGISHELRTPLNIILGFTEIMHESPEVYGEARWPATLRRDLAEVYRSARYLSDMIDDVLDLARVEAALMPVHREPTDLEVVLTEAVEISRGLVRDRHLALAVNVEPGIPGLLIDRARIRQVALNLLANAVRYTEAGSIRVSARQEGDQVVVAVADTGIGIPPEQLDGIFSEYRQVDPRREGDQRGKGLGLAIAKRFVQLHGGSIWAESTVGAGCTVSFSLPIGHKDFSRLRQSEPTRLPPNPYSDCLVVVDSSGLSVSFLRRQLDGHEVLWAKDGESMRSLCARHHPQAVVVNASCPGAPVEVADSLPAGVPVITCSLPTRREAASFGQFRSFLTKPVTTASLLEALGAIAPSGDVLVVDDDRAFVQLVIRTLQTSPAGYSVRWAYSAEEALAKLRSEPATAVVLDMMMPGMDGHELAARMAQEEGLSAIPLLAVSGAAGAAGPAAPIRGSFLVEQAEGIGEREMLGLVRACLQVVHADYTAEISPGSATPGSVPARRETPAETPAS